MTPSEIYTEAARIFDAKRTHFCARAISMARGDSKKAQPLIRKFFSVFPSGFEFFDMPKKQKVIALLFMAEYVRDA